MEREETFSTRLRDLRKEMNLTQLELARETGATQRQVSFWEKGQVEPNLFWLIKLADYFDVTIDYLVGRNY